MSATEQFLGEVCIFPFNYAPTGWAFCQGQLLPIRNNTALFSLLGTAYGGDGKTTFALPDLQGNCVIQEGQGAGLTLREHGEVGGISAVTLIASEIPAHTHSVAGSIKTGSVATTANPVGAFPASGGAINLYSNTAGTGDMAPLHMDIASNTDTGGGQSQPHNNMMPYLTLNFCIAIQGIFPQRH